MLIYAERIAKSEPFQTLFHPWKTNRTLRTRIEFLESENTDLSNEVRDYRKGLGKDKEVSIAAKNAQYWSHKWSGLYTFMSEHCGGCTKIPKGAWK